MEGRKEKERGGHEGFVEATADAEANRSFANSTSSRSIIVAKSAVIMLDILIRGNSKEKLDPTSCVFFSASLSFSPARACTPAAILLASFRLPFTFISRRRR